MQLRYDGSHGMIGRTISQYKVTERIGAGGMGVVYKAEDSELERLVAIKILPPELAQDEAAKERFKQEARTASSLDHPSICTIYQAGETDDGELYLAMAYYEGQTLKQTISAGRLSTGEAVELTAQLASGLERAHNAGIVHRDIKPANIIITEHGEAKLLDFGLAKLAEGARLTREGTTVGTPAYMAPEQLRGSDTDGRADVWSLGVVLFEMLTGELPFKGGADSGFVYSILNDEPEPLVDRRPDLPEPITQAVQQALKKDPEERLSSATAMLDALRPVRSDTPTELFVASEDETEALLPTAGHRSRRAAIWMALIAAVLFLLAAWWWTRNNEEPPAPVPTEAATDATEVITVLPFTFRGNPTYSYLGDGIVDLLSTKLDGAGDLRTSDPHAVLSLVERLEGDDADPKKARAVAEQFGATYFITGEILEAGNRVHVSTSLYEFGESSPISTHSVEGDAEDLFSLVDEIAGELLSEQIQAPSVKVFSTAAMTTSSLPALRAYLRAESELRRGAFTRALASYQETVELDPEFALAWYRLSVAAEWSAQNDLVAPAVAKALEFEDRLSPHDRDLLEARLANRSGDAARSEQIYRSILGRHPDDVEAWVQLSEILSHYGYVTGRSMTESRPALEKVIHYEPTNVGSWWHLARVAAVEEDADEVDRAVKQIIALNPEGERSIEVETLRAVVLGDDEEFSKLLTRLAAVEDHVLTLSAWTLAMTRTDPSHAIAISEVLTRPRRSDEARALGHEFIAWFELARGRVGVAREQIAEAGEIVQARRLEAEPLMLLLPWVPRDEARLIELRQELEAWDASKAKRAINPTNFFAQHGPIHALLRAYLIELLDRETGPTPPPTDIESLEIARIAEGLPDETTRRLGEFFQHSLRAYRLRREGDLAGALEALEAAPFRWAYQDAYASPFYAASLERWTKAEILRDLGRLEDALVWYSTFGEITVADEAFFVPATFRKAEILAGKAETDEAIRLFRLVTELWAGADAPLQSWVEEAHHHIQRLEAESAG